MNALARKLARGVDVACRMSTAIGLLLLLALASVAGTLVEQQIDPQNALREYGPFWHGLFSFVGVYHLYRTPWFLAVGGVLVVSLCLCIYRNGPRLWRQTYVPKKPAGAGVLAAWPLVYRAKGTSVAVEGLLGQYGFKPVGRYANGAVYYRRGRAGRLGYFLTHGGVLCLCVAALLSGFFGFRGQANLLEGQATNHVWLDGGAAQKIPFILRDDNFVLNFYDNGMPRQYTTTLTLMDGKQNTLTQRDIAVNDPLHWGAYSIYQSSFGDGGSTLDLQVRSIRKGTLSKPLKGKVHGKLQSGDGYSFELTDFHPETVEMMLTRPGQQVPQAENFGPSVDYILRGPDMTPIQLRAYLDKPWLIGLGDGENHFSPAFLGLDPTKPGGWALLADLLKHEGDRENQPIKTWAAALRQVGSTHLKHANEDMRLKRGLGAVTAGQLVAGRIPYLLVIKGFNYKPYTGILVSYDPGADFFWIGAMGTILGIMLMLYFPLCRAWLIKDDKGFTLAANTSHPGALEGLARAIDKGAPC